MVSHILPSELGPALPLRIADRSLLHVAAHEPAEHGSGTFGKCGVVLFDASGILNQGIELTRLLLHRAVGKHGGNVMGGFDVPNHRFSKGPFEDKPGGGVRSESRIANQVSALNLVRSSCRYNKEIVDAPIARRGIGCMDYSSHLLEPACGSQVVGGAIPISSEDPRAYEA